MREENYKITSLVGISSLDFLFPQGRTFGSFDIPSPILGSGGIRDPAADSAGVLLLSALPTP